jgi:hypothetical protein
MRFLLGLLLAPTLSNQTYAESMTTDFVIDGCRSADKTQKVDQFKLGLCLGAINALMTQQLNSFAKFCVPSSTTLNEAVRVVLKHVEANPDVHNQLFEGMVADALSDEWPCTHKQLQNEYERGLDEGTKQSTKMIAPLSDYLRLNSSWMSYAILEWRLGWVIRMRKTAYRNCRRMIGHWQTGQ